MDNVWDPREGMKRANWCHVVIKLLVVKEVSQIVDSCIEECSDVTFICISFIANVNSLRLIACCK